MINFLKNLFARRVKKDQCITPVEYKLATTLDNDLINLSEPPFYNNITIRMYSLPPTTMSKKYDDVAKALLEQVVEEKISYMPRSVAVCHAPGGDTIFLAAYRTAEKGNTDWELVMFLDLLASTNDARAYFDEEAL